ncbi:MAG: radical SAM/SPASM domain-containing protein [Bacteroidia bacterium]
MIRKLQSINKRIFPQHLFYQPDWIVLGVNNICNLHCKMCDVGVKYKKSNFYQHLMGASPLNMPLDLIRRIMDQSAQHFPGTKIGYAFTEPGVYPHLMESLAYAKSKNIYTTVTTNGLNLPKIAEGLCENGLKELFISLDGPARVHNEIRGNKRSFELALEGIKKLIEHKGNRPAISIYCTITQWNIGHLKEFTDLFSGFPLKEIGFMHTNYTPQSLADQHNTIFRGSYPATASNMEQIDLEQIDLELLNREISRIRETNYPYKISFSPELNSREALHTFYHQPEIKLGKICNDAFNNILIKSDGTVIPAHGRCYNVMAGNIYENDLREIWNAKSLAEFRKTLIRNGGQLPACSRCCSAF